MAYVPSFLESVIVLGVDVALIAYIGRREPRARLLMPVLLGGVALSMAWGSVSVASGDAVAIARSSYLTMGISLVGLVTTVVWALRVRGRPRVEGSDVEQPPEG